MSAASSLIGWWRQDGSGSFFPEPLPFRPRMIANVAEVTAEWVYLGRETFHVFRLLPLTTARTFPARMSAHHVPVFGIDTQGSLGAIASPFCKSSTETRSGERTNAMCPSRGGRLIVTPKVWSLAQVA